MKHQREEVEQHIDVNLANLLMFLSSNTAVAAETMEDETPSGRVFECKTCNRQFPSFQALGGHRASHKKPRLLDEGQPKISKPRVHECSICGLEFSLGQALGGHMRRHRAAADGGGVVHPHQDEEEVVVERKKKKMMMMMMKGEDEKRSLLPLDLNMPAPLDNDPLLVFSLGFPLVH